MEIKKKDLSLQEKLNILADAAKYDVACTSSGVDRKGKNGSLGNSLSAGICHSFSADGRCISLLKILLSNDCVYDCKYCVNRISNDTVRATFTPEEICTLATEFYRRNYIEGLFLSSGVVKTPAYTAELMHQTILLLRTRYHFNGYIHVKAIPNAPSELIRELGYLADRMSINLELPTTESLRRLAPHKTPSSILKPIAQIQNGIETYRTAIGKDRKMERHRSNRYLSGTIFDTAPDMMLDHPSDPGQSPAADLPGGRSADSAAVSAAEGRNRTPLSSVPVCAEEQEQPTPVSPDQLRKPFVPAGQSTQMIVGASGETDYQLLLASQYMYQTYDLKRVFYSAYIPLNDDPALPPVDTAPPLLREHRLYQADWLLRYYGFRATDLLSEDRPSFNILLDPKCDWALRHLELFPVEINRADYAELLKVPGIGVKSAARIVSSRRTTSLSFEHLKRIGVVLKRAKYFITCSGKMMYRIPVEENFITRQLIGEERRKTWEIEHPDSYRQLSLFDDFHFQMKPQAEDLRMSVTGQL